MSQYDFSTPTNYQERTLFLDPSGQVTVQRFDQIKYTKLAHFEEIARGFYWTPEEINMTKDRQDMKKASEAVQWMVTMNLLRQTSLDSTQGRAPPQVFGPVCSVPELEALLSAWGFFETNIHSRSYSHIVKNIYSVSTEVFNQIHEVEEIVQMAANIGYHYEHLHHLNCRVTLGLPVDRRAHKKAVWMALHASYALEAIRFMVSFATTLGMMENRLFIGIGKSIALIMQDELLHTEWTAWLINQVVKEDPEFRSIAEEMRSEVLELYKGVVDEEKNWAKHLCKKGVVIGLNVAILCSFVDWTAKEKLKDIGISYWDTAPATHPIPWYLKHQNIDSKQAALQETESTNYIVGLVSDNINKEELPDL